MRRDLEDRSMFITKPFGTGEGIDRRGRGYKRLQEYLGRHIRGRGSGCGCWQGICFNQAAKDGEGRRRPEKGGHGPLVGGLAGWGLGRTTSTMPVHWLTAFPSCGFFLRPFGQCELCRRPVNMRIKSTLSPKALREGIIATAQVRASCLGHPAGS